MDPLLKFTFSNHFIFALEGLSRVKLVMSLTSMEEMFVVFPVKSVIYITVTFFESELPSFGVFESSVQLMLHSCLIGSSIAGWIICDVPSVMV